MLGFGPSKSTDIKRLTKEQLAHVFQVPKKEGNLKGAPYSKKGALILKDVIKKEYRAQNKLPVTSIEKKRRIKLREQQEKEKKRRLWEDWWGVIANVTRAKEGRSGADGTIGSSPIGFFPIP